MSRDWDEVDLFALAERINQRAEDIRAANVVNMPEDIEDPMERLAHLVASQKPKGSRPHHTNNVIPFRAR